MIPIQGGIVVQGKLSPTLAMIASVRPTTARSFCSRAYHETLWAFVLSSSVLKYCAPFCDAELSYYTSPTKESSILPLTYSLLDGPVT